MTEQDKLNLLQLARQARQKSYSPYSGFSVGCALLAKDGRVFCGCNVENATYTPTICAERVALFSAVYQGVRDFVAIAIVGGKKDSADEICPPCGVCRQALREFCKDEFEIILGTDEKIETYTLGQLLPLSFDQNNLK